MNIVNIVQEKVDSHLENMAFAIRTGNVEVLFDLNEGFKNMNHLIYKYLSQAKIEIYSDYQRGVHSACMSVVSDRMRSAGLYMRGEQ